jgi:CzcA family heavy metal efflux pump
MNFSAWIQSHRRSILFLLVVLAVGGLASSLSLPVSLFPHVEFPRVLVSLEAGDRPAERMTVEVTTPVEEAVRAVPGVRTVRSTTSRGAADVVIGFDWGENMVSAMLQVESMINQVRGSLPTGTTFEVRRMDPTVFPVIGYSLTSDTRSLTELRELALYQIKPVLSTVQGVAKIEVLGGATAEYRIAVDPARIDALGLGMDDVAKALSGANVISAVGRLEQYEKLYLVVVNTELADRDAIARSVIRAGPNGIVRLQDVAQVTMSTVPEWTRVTADGHDAVLFQAIQQPDANTVAIRAGIQEKLKALGKMIPPDVKVANWYDQSRLIVASAQSVLEAVLIGIGLSAVVLLLFLRNFKVTAIALLTVPMTLASTILLLYALNMSFNIMTLGGMAAAVGLIIDDSIVLIEHVVRRFRGGAGEVQGRVMAAAVEFTKPLAGSSASTIIIFTPLAFLTGVTGSFFKSLALTMASSLIISYFMAWLMIPILSARFLKAKDAAQKEGGFLAAAVHRVYGAVMGVVLPYPWLILLVLVPLLAFGYVAYEHTGTGLMPKEDEGGFILDYVAPAGTSLAETDRLLRQVEEILGETPEVDTYSRRTGLQLGAFLTEANTGDFFVRLKPRPRRDIDEVMQEVRKKVEKSVPGLEVELIQQMEDLIGDLTGVPQPIEIKLFSDDGELLSKLGPKVKEAIEEKRDKKDVLTGGIEGVVEVKNGIVPAGDALEIHVDLNKAAIEGMTTDAVTSVLAAYLEGNVATQVQRGPKMVGLRVWIPQSPRETMRAIEDLRIRAPDGHLFPAKRVATLETIIGQPEITREDLKRMIAVVARIEGRDMGSTIRDVKAVLARPGMIPPGVYWTLGGLYEQQQIAFTGLVAVFGAAVLLVFCLLLYLYDSFRVATAMLLTTLTSLAAVFVGLWLTGTELNITAMMGMTMIVGIVTEVGIFYYSEYDELRDMKELYPRMILAGQNRMRPIAMTTLAAILALSPLALGIGEGAEMQKPLAIAIISGLVVQLPLALVVLPALLSFFGHGKPKEPVALA